MVGAGGLGCTVLQLLTRYGFGEIHLYDDGIVDKADLNRQILYSYQDIDSPKVIAAKNHLQEINPKVTIIAHQVRLTGESSVPAVDLVIDCLDNFAGRLFLNDRFFEYNIPVIHGGVSTFFGQVTTLIPGRTLSLVDIFGRDNMYDNPDISKNIYPPVVIAVASLQASEAIKLACGLYKRLLLNKIQVIDMLDNSFDIIEIR